jgi:hypothetical protein
MPVNPCWSADIALRANRLESDLSNSGGRPLDDFVFILPLEQYVYIRADRAATDPLPYRENAAQIPK